MMVIKSSNCNAGNKKFFAFNCLVPYKHFRIMWEIFTICFLLYFIKFNIKK